jgi:hypothetical protein
MDDILDSFLDGDIYMKITILSPYLISILSFLLTILIKTRLENSVSYEYLKTQKSSSIGRLLATWITKPRDFESDQEYQQYNELNALLFELVLWLPDKTLLKELLKRLKNKPDAKPTLDLLLDCRPLIQKRSIKNSTGEISIDDLTYFTKDEN